MEATAPLHITVTPNPTGYKSIRTIFWDNIAPFSIITGRNGSGKTQFLELLAYYLTDARPQYGNFGVRVDIQGHTFDADEVGFVPSTGRFSGGRSLSLSDLQDLAHHLYQNSSQGNRRHDPMLMSRSRRIDKMLNGRDSTTAMASDRNRQFQDVFETLIGDVDITENLETVFLAHRVKLAEAFERGTPGRSRDGKEIGPAPWDVINESLKIADFPYEIDSPTKVGLLDVYKVKLYDKVNKIYIDLFELSSGEKALLQLVLWLFCSGKGNSFPKLLLLDEPDAHLHPSMTVQFLDVISEVLVRKHGVRVIMTTHSPSTVALAPDGSVFQMERGQPQITPVTDRAEIISVLTAGLITVSPATHFCFVEDEDDVKFYNTVRDLLTDVGPSKDPCAIRASPSLVFIAASIGRGSEKMSGGKSVVAKWLEKLDADPLIRTFRGVIDRDENMRSSGRLKVIGRYSFENYLLDPINVFGLLMEENTSPEISGAKFSSGDEHTLRNCSESILQAISDVITSKVDIYGASQESERIEIVYTNNKRIIVPEWVVNYRGHDLLKSYQNAWGGHQLINMHRLNKVLRRIRLIPRDLADLFHELQI